MSVTRTRVAAASAVAFALVAGYFAQGSLATTTSANAANKVAASGSEATDVPFGTATPILSETIKINNPTDAIISVSLECSITTQVTSSADNKTSQAFGQIKIFVTIDGAHVPVSQDDTDAGRVVFCNRTQEQQWNNSAGSTDGDQNDTLRQKLVTRDANAFNWLALNVGQNYQPADGSNVHKVEVWAEWTGGMTGAGNVADATIGNRTLILDPVKAANGETVVPLS